MKKIFILTSLLGLYTIIVAQTTFYNADFASGLSPWTTVSNTPQAWDVWKYKKGTFSSYYSGTVSFKSTTAINGYVYFLSDSSAKADNGTAEDADLISPVINCGAQNYVFLQFDQYYRHLSTSSTYVSVSTNGNNWTQVYSKTTTSPNAETVVIDITPFAANQPSVYIKFNYKGDYAYFWAIDDVKLVVPEPVDVSIDTVTISRYVGLGNQVVTGQLTNRGGTTINSFRLGYTDNSGADVFQNFTGLNIPPLGTYNFTFAQPIVMNTAVQHEIVVTAYDPNNATDGNLSNNSWTQNVITLSAVPSRNVLLEEFTTAPCQYCPGAGSRLVEIIGRNPNMILASLHAGFGTDAMTIPDHSTVAAQYTTSAPAVMVDRGYYDSEKGADIGFYNDPYDRWEPYGQARASVITPVSLIADNTYNSATRELTVNVSAKFYSGITDEFRLNCYIIEDSVYKPTSTSGYNQSNAYNNTSSSPWYQKGNPIIGYRHRHVVRQMLGGAWGSSGSIASTTSDQGIYTKQYTYTLPSTWREEQITLVPIVQHYAGNKFDRQIMNALELHLNSADSNAVTVISSLPKISGVAVESIGLYPNPASEQINLVYTLTSYASFNFEIRNLLGQMVTKYPIVDLPIGSYKTRVNTDDFKNGVYFVSVKDGNKVIKSLKFVVNK